MRTKKTKQTPNKPSVKVADMPAKEDPKGGVTLSYGKIEVTYTTQKPDGTTTTK